MARAGEIRARARKALALYMEDENYLYLWEVKDSISVRESKRLGIKSLLGCTSRLEYAIITDDLLAMRRYENSADWLVSFESCAEKIREILRPVEKTQGLSMSM